VRRTRWSLLVPVAFGLAGLLFATSAGAANGTDLRGGERSELADLIREEEARLAAQLREVEALRADVDRLSAGAAEGDGRVSAARQEAERVAAAAHVIPVEGPALRVVLSDAPITDPDLLPPEVVPDDLVVHQQDLQAVVNALWAGGAEAIQLMDQRIIATSAVRCVGNVLILQGRTYPPPYEVTAIGDVPGMEAALAASRGVQDYLFYVDWVGLGYEQTRLGTVTIPAYEGALDLVHASVPDSGLPSPAPPASGSASVRVSSAAR
jgi:uncharacterized protein YlxW (UPF0749 family)